MAARAFAFAVLIFAALAVRAQEVTIGRLHEPRSEIARPPVVASAWLDLRQDSAGKAGPQSAPAWVKAVTMLPREAKDSSAAKTVIRVELTRPTGDFPLLMFRLFFDDRSDRRPLGSL
jgi:hypothetical protein